MGKKRIVKTGTADSAEGKAKTEGASKDVAAGVISAGASTKKRYDFAHLYVQSTYNNTRVLLTDAGGNALAASSSGALGFAGAKKGTPFAAAKVGETVGAKAQTLGVKEVAVIVKGVGSGRESAIRGFISKSIGITSIKDATPVPFNGPKPKKPRRV
jgi:small subunit ribosomal protein S11